VFHNQYKEQENVHQLIKEKVLELSVELNNHVDVEMGQIVHQLDQLQESE